MATNPGRTGLVSWWSLDEASGTRADSHGSNTLTDVNTVGSAAGKVGTAADFESSSSEQLTIADNASLSIGGNSPFTMAAWVKPESLTSDQGVMGKWVGGAGSEYVLAYYPTGFVVAAQNASNTQVTLFGTTHGGATVGSWYFVIAWYDPADGKLRIQVNNGGVDASIASLSGGVRDGAGTFRIGRYTTTDAYWDGLIDEVSLWKRVLTTDEREWLYNSGAGRSYAETSTGSPAMTQAHAALLARGA